MCRTALGQKVFYCTQEHYSSRLLRPSPISTLIKGEDGQIKWQRLSGSPQTLLCTATFGDPHVVMLSDRCLCSGSQQSLPCHMKPGLRVAQQIKNLVTFKWKFSHGKLTETVYFTNSVSVATLQLSPKLAQKLGTEPPAKSQERCYFNPFKSKSFTEC